MTAPKNVWEAEGRARKCAALCRAIDASVVVVRREALAMLRDGSAARQAAGMLGGTAEDVTRTAYEVIERTFSPAGVAKLLRSKEDVWWSKVAAQNGIRAPSAATIEAVCLEYEARAEELAHAVDGAFDRLDDMAVDERWER